MYLKIKIHPEIITKSDSVRKRFTKILASNIRQSLQNFGLECAITRNWDNILVRAKCDPSLYPAFVQILCQVPGIQAMLKIKILPYTDFHSLFEEVLALNKERLAHKSFAVRVKRKGKHDFKSIDLERYIGGGLRQHIEGATVNLTKPQEVVNIEIDREEVCLVEAIFKGCGGFPIGTQGAVLSLISGGYDSAVSSYQMIRRGCKTHYLFLNLGGQEHVQHVKGIVRKIWNGYSASHNVKFINIDFYNIMLNISNYVSDGYTAVVLKRMFYRVASEVARRFKFDALVTGEALGQVSSQTLKNLQVIEKAADYPVLRPLIATDKEEIIQIAKEIGTAELSAKVQEFCGIMGQKPTIAADLETLLAEEAKLDVEKLVEEALASAQVVDLRTLAKEEQETIEATKLTFVDSFGDDDVVIDVRDTYTYELANNAWPVPALNIPFFNLGQVFADLNPKKRYCLYCSKGLLSRIQAVNLIEAGYHNIAVVSKDYVPAKQGKVDSSVDSSVDSLAGADAEKDIVKADLALEHLHNDKHHPSHKNLTSPNATPNLSVLLTDDKGEA